MSHTDYFLKAKLDIELFFFKLKPLILKIHRACIHLNSIISMCNGNENKESSPVGHQALEVSFSPALYIIIMITKECNQYKAKNLSLPDC